MKIDVFAVFHLLWAHVHQRTHYRSCLRHRKAFFDLGDAEVQQLDVAPVVHEKVRRFDVAMHDAHGVRVFEGMGDLVPPTSQILFRKAATFLQKRFKVGAFEVFHDDAVPIFDVAIAVHLPDIGMVELDHQKCLVVESLYNLRVI